MTASGEAPGNNTSASSWLGRHQWQRATDASTIARARDSGGANVVDDVKAVRINSPCRLSRRVSVSARGLNKDQIHRAVASFALEAGYAVARITQTLSDIFAAIGENSNDLFAELEAALKGHAKVGSSGIAQRVTDGDNRFIEVFEDGDDRENPDRSFRERNKPRP